MSITALTTAPALATTEASPAKITLPEITEVAPLVRADLVSISGKGSMIELFSKIENGAQFLAQAKELAEKTTLTNLKPLLDHGQAARDAVAAVSNHMIGDSTVGGIGPVGTLFSELKEIGKQVNIAEISAPQPAWKQFAATFPWIGKYFQPIYQVMERYKKVKPIIEEHEKSLARLEAERVQNRELYLSLKQAEIDGYRTLEVAIAGAELVMERELEKFSERQTQVPKDDIIGLAELKSTRDQLTNLDNRLMRLQGARADSILDFPMIDQAIASETSLCSTLEDLRVIAIPQIRKGAGMANKINEARQAAVFATGVDEMNTDLRNANMQGLGMLQEETFKVATKAAQDALKTVEGFQVMAKILERGDELFIAGRDLNTRVRAQLNAAESTFKDALFTALQSVAETPVSAQ